MQFLELRPRTGLENQKYLRRGVRKFETLLEDLNGKEFPEEVRKEISLHLEAFNALADDDPKLKRHLRKTYRGVLRILEKKLKWVPRGYYRTVWMAIGMSVFGIPMGAAFGLSLGNMAFLGIGLPIGMAIGLGLGTAMDAKAAKEGRQLNVDMG